VIPVEIQDAIRARCGDQRPADNPQLFSLPDRCDIDIPPAAAAGAARALRSHPELVDDLRWHTAAAASYLNNVTAFEMKTKTLANRIEALD
jgi:hypothetical protein